MKNSRIAFVITGILLLLMLFTMGMKEKSKLEIAEDAFVKGNTIAMVKYKMFESKWVSKIEEFENVIDKEMFDKIISEEKKYFEYSDGVNDHIVQILDINDEKYIEVHSFEPLYQDDSQDWFLDGENFMRLIPNSAAAIIEESSNNVFIYDLFRAIFQTFLIVSFVISCIVALMEKFEKR